MSEKEQDSSQIQIPSPEEMFLQVPLYRSFGIDVQNQSKSEITEKILDIEFFDGAIKTFCVPCKEESVFRTDRITSGELLKPYLQPRIVTVANDTRRTRREDFPPNQNLIVQPYFFSDHFFTVEFYCTHKHEHRLAFCFAVQNLKFTKIGQYPSISDLSLPGNRKYKKVLTKEKMAEFTRAINLFSHDIGIGSFVYLRRIFESFIMEAYEKAKNFDTWEDEDFITKRMEDKILSLKSFLPSVLVENRSLYGILSKGVHELSEEECLDYFDAVRTAIELILDEKVAEKIKEGKTQEINETLTAIKSKIKNTG